MILFFSGRPNTSFMTRPIPPMIFIAYDGTEGMASLKEAIQNHMPAISVPDYGSKFKSSSKIMAIHYYAYLFV